MKALVYHGLKAFKDRPKPAIQAPGDAIVQMVKTTICGTDLHILKGDVPTCAPGRILGHEGVGRPAAGFSATRSMGRRRNMSARRMPILASTTYPKAAMKKRW
jgi:alcohol dehydrogenase